MRIRIRATGILIALALVLASAQCITACAVADCQTHDNVPPCHEQHHGHSHHKVPVACSHDLGTGRTTHLTTQISPCDFSGAASSMTVVVFALNVAAGYGATRQNSSPPGLTCLSAVVLRI